MRYTIIRRLRTDPTYYDSSTRRHGSRCRVDDTLQHLNDDWLEEDDTIPDQRVASGVISGEIPDDFSPL